MPTEKDTAHFTISGDDEPTPASPASKARASAAFDKYFEKTLHSPRPRDPPSSSPAGDDDDLAEALRRSLEETCPLPDVGSPKKKARWNVPLAAEGTFLDEMDSSEHPPLTPAEPFPGPDEEFHDPVAAEGDLPDGQGLEFAGLPAEPAVPPAAAPRDAPRDAPAVAADEGTLTPDLDLRTLQSEILTMLDPRGQRVHHEQDERLGDQLPEQDRPQCHAAREEHR